MTKNLNVKVVEYVDLQGRSLGEPTREPDESTMHRIQNTYKRFVLDICIRSVPHQVPLSIPLDHYLVISLFYSLWNYRSITIIQQNLGN